MHTTERRSRFPETFWGLVSLLYVTALVQRWTHGGQAPGLASATAAGALIAVWMQIHRSRIGAARIEYRRRVTFALLAVLAFVIGVNVALGIGRAAETGEVPLVPAVATFLFSYVFRAVLLDRLRGEQRPGSAAKNP